MGSLAYSLLCAFLGAFAESRGVTVIPLTGEVILVMLLATLYITAAHLTAIRMLCAGVILSCVGFITDKKSMVGVWQSKSDSLKLIIYAVLGVMMAQLTYMQAIAYTNSGTATILTYTGPVLVMMRISIIGSMICAFSICRMVFGGFERNSLRPYFFSLSAASASLNPSSEVCKN